MRSPWAPQHSASDPRRRANPPPWSEDAPHQATGRQRRPSVSFFRRNGMRIVPSSSECCGVPAPRRMHERRLRCVLIHSHERPQSGLACCRCNARNAHAVERRHRSLPSPSLSLLHSTSTTNTTTSRCLLAAVCCTRPLPSRRLAWSACMKTMLQCMHRAQEGWPSSCFSVVPSLCRRSFSAPSPSAPRLAKTMRGQTGRQAGLQNSFICLLMQGGDLG
jgi:hypothetical protein